MYVTAHIQEDRLHLPAHLPPGLGNAGVHEEVGGNPLAGLALVPRQHPDDHVWDAILGLDGEGAKSGDVILQLVHDVLVIVWVPSKVVRLLL